MNKRNLLIAGVLVIVLSVTGVTMAAHGNKTDKPKKFTTVVQDANDPSKTITVESTPTDTAAPVVAPNATVATTPQATPTTDPIEAFHQAVIAKATQIYPYAQASGMAQDNFIWAQYWCIYDRGTDKSSVTQADLDSKLTFFDPISVDANGTPHYQYFDGGCRVHTT